MQWLSVYVSLSHLSVCLSVCLCLSLVSLFLLGLGIHLYCTHLHAPAVSQQSHRQIGSPMAAGWFFGGNYDRTTMVASVGHQKKD